MPVFTCLAIVCGDEGYDAHDGITQVRNQWGDSCDDVVLTIAKLEDALNKVVR